MFRDKTNNLFYVCKKYRNNNDNTDKTIKALEDQNLDKIFEDPVELFSYIFSSTSQNSQKYIMKTLANSTRIQVDYNLDREGMVLALQKSVREITGKTPKLNCGGGTSDSRFLHSIPRLELGLTNEYIHQINERVKIKDLKKLTRIYYRILENYFK